MAVTGHPYRPVHEVDLNDRRTTGCTDSVSLIFTRGSVVDITLAMLCKKIAAVGGTSIISEVLPRYHLRLAMNNECLL
jgi:hypothetical protein